MATFRPIPAAGFLFGKGRWQGACVKTANAAAITPTVPGPLPADALPVGGWGQVDIAFLGNANNGQGTYTVEGFTRAGDSDEFIPEILAAGASATAVTIGQLAISANIAAAPDLAAFNLAGLLFADTLTGVGTFPLASVRSQSLDNLAVLSLKIHQVDFIRVQVSKQGSLAFMAAMMLLHDQPTW